MDGCFRNLVTDRRRRIRLVATMERCYYYQMMCVLIVVFLSVSSGFNLEPRVPLVKQGPNGSYFGYSVAQHIIEVGGLHRRYYRLLVGAPKFRNMGTVYQCPLTTLKTDCEELQIQETTIASDELREDQWLGVTVKSQGPGGYALACAHRYVVKPTDSEQWGYGVCYTLTSNLDYDDYWMPCDGRSVAKAHEEFGYCQTGTSAMITENNNALFGSPGPYTWKGTVFSNNVRKGIEDDIQWYLGPLDANSPVDKYSYLGMSVAAGRFIGDTLSYVAGAPRSNGTGQVIFFTKIPSVPTYDVQLILSGDTFASSFGYELATIDLNNDKLLDLVVGAPFYYGKEAGGAIYVYMNSINGLDKTPPERITGKPDSRFGFALANIKDLNKDGYEDLAVGAPYENHGVVYIYFGSAKGLTKNSEPAQVIRSQDLPGVPVPTFGYSLSGGLDMDNSGYPDLLVGAYEADRIMLIRSRPIIDIETDVRGNLSNIDPSTLGCWGDRESKLICFTITTCFRIKESSGPLNIKYQLIAEAFGNRQFSRATLARSTDPDAKYRIEEIIRVEDSSDSRQRCKNERVYVQDTRDILNPIKFKLTYSLQQDAPRSESVGSSILNINRYPVLNQQEATRYFQVTFEKDCGTDDDICESNLITNAILNATDGKIHLGTFRDLTINVTVNNTNDAAYEAAVYLEHPLSLSYKGYRKEGVGCELVNETLIKCPLGNPFKRNEYTNIMLIFNPARVQDSERSLEFTIKANSTSAELIPKEDLKISAEIVRRAEYDIEGSGPKDQVFYGGEIRGESAIKTEDQVGSHINITYHVRNRGPWKAGNISVVISWPYEVENKKKHGKWLLYLMEKPRVDGHGECIIDPSRINPLKLEKTAAPLRLENTYSEEVANLEYGNRTTQRAFGSRRKRENTEISEDVVQERKTNKVVTMDCETKTAKCFDFTCLLYNLEPNTTEVIRIRSRLWNSTFVEDYPDVDWVVIKSRARIVIDPSLGIEQDTRNDHAVARISISPDIEVSQIAKEVPIWIIIVAVCAGVLLLIIIILVLWKLGFFRRKKHEAMMKGNLEKHPNETNNIDH